MAPLSGASKPNLSASESGDERQSTRLVGLYHYVFLVLTIVSFAFGMIAAAAGILFVFEHPDRFVVTIVIEVVSGLGFVFARWCQSKYETFLDRVGAYYYLNLAFSDPKYNDMVESLIARRLQLSRKNDVLLLTEERVTEVLPTDIQAEKDRSLEGAQKSSSSPVVNLNRDGDDLLADGQETVPDDIDPEMAAMCLDKIHKKIKSSGEPTPMASGRQVAEWLTEFAHKCGRDAENIIEALLRREYLNRADPGRLQVTWKGRAFLQEMREKGRVRQWHENSH